MAGIPATDDQYLQSLIQTRNNVARELQLETQSRAMTGAVHPYILAGKTVTSEEWRTVKMQQLKDLNAMIAELDVWELGVQCG